MSKHETSQGTGQSAAKEGMTSSVLVERNGPVTTITINRPEVRNAVDRPTADALRAAFKAFEADGEAKVAVFTGADGAFCAGADLKAVAAKSFDKTPGDRRNDIDPDGEGPMGPSRMLLSKPVIAAIAGPAVAGGFELAIWCDLRVMEEDAVMGVYCRRWGVPLIDGGTVRLPRLIGHSRALDLILTGRPVHAEEALAMGLVNRVVAKGRARIEAEKLALDISRFPQACMRADRMSSYRQWDQDLRGALGWEARGGVAVLMQEGIAGAARFASGKGRHGNFNDLWWRADAGPENRRYSPQYISGLCKEYQLLDRDAAMHYLDPLEGILDTSLIDWSIRECLETATRVKNIKRHK